MFHRCQCGRAWRACGHGHRIDGFKMARVGNEVDVNLRAALGRVLAGGADVIFDVSLPSTLRGSTSSNSAKTSSGLRWAM